MSTTTPNIGLIKPLGTEFYNVETVQNANSDKIDTAIGNLETAKLEKGNYNGTAEDLDNNKQDNLTIVDAPENDSTKVLSAKGGKYLEDKIDNLFKAYEQYNNATGTSSTITHDDISNYDFMLIEFAYRGWGKAHRFLPVPVWLSTGETSLTVAGGERADKNYTYSVIKNSNTTMSSNNSELTIYKLIFYKF